MTTPTVSPAMRAVIEHLQELGPRWGLERDTCAAHAVLYLVGRPMAKGDLARCLGLDEPATEAAIEDLVGWRMARRTPAGLVGASGEPWDLLFAACSISFATSPPSATRSGNFPRERWRG